jgi:sodium/hydrogen exchanger 10/11
MKRQLSAPSYIHPPSPEVLLRSTVWLEGMDEEIIDYIASLAVEKIFDSGDTIVRQGDKTDGMYLIITGLVKVCSYRIISICRKPALHLLDSSIRFFFLEVRYKSHPLFLRYKSHLLLVSLGSRYACGPPPPPCILPKFLKPVFISRN